MLYCAARQVGDYVRTAEVEGHKSIWSRVLFTHTHAELADTVGISHSNEGSPVCLSLSLSPASPVSVCWVIPTSATELE